MDCPRCETPLEVSFCSGGRMLRCPECGGTAVTVEMLRRFAPKERVDDVWRQAQSARGEHAVRCAGCEGPLRPVDIALSGAHVRLDVCTHCHLVWFDASELRAFSPDRAEPDVAEEERVAAAAHLGIRAPSGASRDEVWRIVTNLQGLLR